MCPKSLRESILGKVGDAAQRTPLPTYILNTPKPLTDDIEVGSFYEIDHSKLPPRSPTQLHSVRLVMVTAKTELNVTVRYPSTQSLEAYFGNMECVAVRLKLYPALDEKFVMGPKLAIEVLGHQIPSEEFAELRHSKTFWVIGSVGVEQLPSPLSVSDDGGTSDSKSKKKAGALFSKLQSSTIKGWGSQRVVAYLQDSKQLNGPHKAISEVRVKEEEKENQDTEGKEVVHYLRKRKPGRPARDVIKKKTKHNPKPKLIEPKSEIKEHKEGGYIDRWPVKRYEAAAKKLLDVLKANGAIYGNPISRFKLREEARSQIGDTGLLDHLLKHLAGKVVPGGNERLRRRCDSEGKMEYWLESKDLVDIRKQAGVQDPYWTPPPGWKPGDCLSAHDCICCQQVSLLKEELGGLRRQMVELKSKNEEEQAITVAVYSRKLNSSNPKEMYESLLKNKSIMEEQLLQVSKTLMELEEDMKMLSHKEAAAKQESLILTNTKRSRGDEMSITEIEEDNLGEGAQGELSESDGEKSERDYRRAKIRSKKAIKMKMKLKPCGQQENVNTNISSPMALTPASASPLSTTTS